jgi:hypothetical protein
MNKTSIFYLNILKFRFQKFFKKKLSSKFCFSFDPEPDPDPHLDPD